MNGKILLLILVAFVVLSTLGSAAELTVCSSGCDYTRIDDAVGSADPGDTIIVGDGTYIENVMVDRPLTIRSENGAGKTVVTAEDSDNHVFTITANYVNLSGFTVTGASEWGRMGIYLIYADHCNISDNNASNNWEGIHLSNSSNNTITRNTVSNSCDVPDWCGGGIDISYSSSNIITGNTVNSNKWYGIILWHSSNNIITSNTFINDGLYAYYSYQNNITDNTVNGKPLVYLEGVSDTTVTDAGQVILVRCNNITVTGLTLSDTSEGIVLWETNNSIISNNIINSNKDCGIEVWDSNSNSITRNIISNNSGGLYLRDSDSNSITSNIASNNRYGIYLDSSNNNTVMSNTANSNTENHGIWLGNSCNNTVVNNTANENNKGGIYLNEDSSNNILSGNTVNSNNHEGIYLCNSHSNTIITNTVSNNLYGISFHNSSINTIHNNYFSSINNVNDVALDYVSANIWNTTKTLSENIIGGNYSGGNYWSDYNGTDANRDGIGDTPYVINSDNIDYLPLVTTECDLPGDYPPCGEVTLTEVIDYINLWAQGQASLPEVIDLINTWAAS